MAWTFELTDLQRNRIGEIRNAADRTVSIGLSRIDTASFKLRIENPLLPYLISSDCLVKVYDGTTLRFWGPVTSLEMVGDEATGVSIAITASGPAWRLTKRLCGKSPAGALYTAQDRAAIAKDLIDVTNAENNTQIQTTGISSGSLTTFTAGPYQPISQVIQTLSQTIDGFDWIITPVDGVAGKIGRFDAASIIGSQRVDTVFEYAIGKSSVRGFNLQKSWSDLANQLYHIPDDGPASPSGVAGQQDVGSVNERGLYEDMLESQNITDAGLRNTLVGEGIRLRKQPRLVLTFSPDFADPNRPGRVPVLGTDYWIGDLVRCRGAYHDTVLFDGWLRIYAIQVALDKNGKATITPTVVDEEGAAT